MANQKAERLQSEAKAQTFGVEIECNGITRKDAAKCAAGFFGTGRYEDTAWRNGYQTWSAWDGQNREWKFSRDVSIQGPDSEKCELVTPILRYEDLETLQSLCRALRKAGAKSDYSRGCGIHVHVGGEGHTAKTLRNLTNLMASHEDLLIHSIRIDRSRTERYCRTVDPDFLRKVNSRKPKTLRELEDIWYRANGATYGREQHYNDSRYHMLNLHSFFHGHGTVEFRLFQFDKPNGEKRNGIHAGDLKAFIQLALHLNAYAKLATGVSAKVGQRENEKYAFRTWLLRLGFIGADYETARERLTMRLEGNGAWRNR